MNKVKIEIIQLGASKHLSEINRLQKFSRHNKSKLFEITSIKEVSLSNTDGYNWSYSDEKLRQFFTNTSADIQIGIIDHPIEDNYFARKLSPTKGVISFYEVDDLLNGLNISLLNFLLIIIYESITLFVCNKNNSKHIDTFSHDETRGCIFDMCGIKSEIIVSASNPQICFECETKMRQTTLNVGYIEILKKELKKIKKPLYFRFLDWVKKHPIWSVIITVVTTIIVNILSSVLFELINTLFL